MPFLLEKSKMFYIKPKNLNSLEQKAWELYCKETAGGMDVRDHWEELPQRVREHYLTKVL